MLVSPTPTPELARQHQAHKERVRRQEMAARRGAGERPSPVRVEINDHQPKNTSVEIVAYVDQVVHVTATAGGAAGIKVSDIQRAVCRRLGISRMDMLSARRGADIVRARHIAMFLAKKLTLRSLPDIGRRFGGRDHTTVLHAVRKITKMIESDDPIIEDVSAIETRLVEE